MNRNQVKGAAKDMAGKVQEKVGAAVGSDRAQAKGLAKQAAGKAQKAAGDVQSAVKDSTKPTRRTTSR